MTAGSVLHVPDFDATIVSRILDAGGEIWGIAATEDMSLSGASLSAVTGQVRNPHDASRSAGGSSSGVAALVASGAADAGIGADQGGSIGIPSSQAQNLAVAMRRAYDAVLESSEVLVMPTTCITAPRLPAPDPEPLAAIDLGLDPTLISNTCAFNHAGHPALGVPIGPPDGLPVGLMLVGRRHDDATVLRAAGGLEAAGHTLAPGVA